MFPENNTEIVKVFFHNPLNYALIFVGECTREKALQLCDENRALHISSGDENLPEYFKENQAVKNELNRILRETYKNHDKIEAIKQLRRLTDMGLKEAKDYIEELCL